LPRWFTNNNRYRRKGSVNTALDEMDELIRKEGSSPEQILNVLLSKDGNLAMKTEIENPLELALLNCYADHLDKKKLKRSAKFIRGFIEWYLQYMVSYRRKSRKEIIDALIALRDQTTGQSLTQRLISPNSKKGI